MFGVKYRGIPVDPAILFSRVETTYCDVFLVRDLSENQLKDLPPGIFSNNTKLRDL